MPSKAMAGRAKSGHDNSRTVPFKWTNDTNDGISQDDGQPNNRTTTMVHTQAAEAGPNGAVLSMSFGLEV